MSIKLIDKYLDIDFLKDKAIVMGNFYSFAEFVSVGTLLSADLNNYWRIHGSDKFVTGIFSVNESKFLYVFNLNYIANRYYSHDKQSMKEFISDRREYTCKESALKLYNEWRDVNESC